MYKLTIKTSARKELDAISNDQFLKIDAAILALKTNPHPYPQSKKLKGEDKCRLRVGDYRVVYTVAEKEKQSLYIVCAIGKMFTGKGIHGCHVYAFYKTKI